MEKLIGYCGIDCSECDAYLATKNNDQALQEKTAVEWSKAHDYNITPEMINCVSCKGNGIKHRSSECEVYKCASGKGIVNCGACDEFKTCSTISDFLEECPNELKNQILERFGKL